MAATMSATSPGSLTRLAANKTTRSTGRLYSSAKASGSDRADASRDAGGDQSAKLGGFSQPTAQVVGELSS